ncbi:MAG: putative beta-lysine N-acetyltransferase [Victivallaceae bacterium]|nr:putative beta-lysine N-acetyltransferase [Victivallaceae bacterium]
MTDFDRMERLPCGALIQHGPGNNRIYLMKTGGNIPPELPAELTALAKTAGYTKIFVKLPSDRREVFIQNGFRIEASVPGLYNGVTDGVFLAYYLSESRTYEPEAAIYGKNMILAFNKKTGKTPALDANRFRLRSCGENDLGRMAEIYRTVFPSYPFPVHDPDYLRTTMNGHVDYFGVETRGKIVALASAEKDDSAANAEMTDFATLPEWRGHGFGSHLLSRMERAMNCQGIKTAYTIARAASPGMNITFCRQGYAFGGRLKNNTNIAGKIESMNVWYKAL